MTASAGGRQKYEICTAMQAAALFSADFRLKFRA